MDEIHRLTLSVEEAAAVIGISRNSAYRAVRDGNLPAVRIGKRLVVPTAALERWLLDEAAKSQRGIEASA